MVFPCVSLATHGVVFFFVFLCINANAEVVPKTQVATACFSCSPPDLNFLDPYFIFVNMPYNHCHGATAHLQLVIIIVIIISAAWYVIRGHTVSDTDSVVKKHKNILQVRFTARILNCNSELEW